MIKIYGASDDLIEIEGDLQEEFSCYMPEGEKRFLAISDGTLLEVQYDGNWRFHILKRGSGEVIIIPPDESKDEYSDIVTIKGEARPWVALATNYVDKKGLHG